MAKRRSKSKGGVLKRLRDKSSRKREGKREKSTTEGIFQFRELFGPKWEKEMSFNEIWRIMEEEYAGKKRFNKRDVEDYARAMVEAAEHILEKKPTVIIVPLRGAYPLWRCISFALSELKKKRYEEALGELEKLNIRKSEKEKRIKQLKKEILDYHPSVLSPPNTGKLRSMIVDYISFHKGLSDLSAKIQEMGEKELSLHDLVETAKQRPQLYRFVRHILDNLPKTSWSEKKKISNLLTQLKRIRKLAVPDFSKVMLIDEVSGGGAISKNYEFLKRALEGSPSELHVLGIAETDRQGTFKLREDTSYLLRDGNVKLVPVKKLVTMDNIRLVGITYISRSSTGVKHFGVDRGAKLSTDVAPTPLNYFKQHKWFIKLVDAKIKEIIYKAGKEDEDFLRALPPTLRSIMRGDI